MKRPKVVLDTNTIVSALLLTGTSNRLADLWESGAFEILICREMIEEYTKVFACPKFKLSEEDVHIPLQRHILPFTHPVKLQNILP